MTHSEYKTMIRHLITYLQHNWFIGAIIATSILIFTAGKVIPRSDVIKI